jgi:hypothetical protein
VRLRGFRAMTAAHARPFRFFLRALGLCVAAFLPACGLVLDLDPPDGSALECRAVVRSADGQRESVSSLTSPDFVEITTLPDGTTETAAIRGYFLCTSGPCPEDCPRGETVAGAQADWESWLGIRVREKTADATSVFGQFEGPWCLEPDSLRCVDAGPLPSSLTCGLLPAADRLPVCVGPPPPPPGDPCIRIECDGTAPCETLDFGSVNLDSPAIRTVVVSNCGGTAAPDISLTLSGDVLADVAFTQGDFAVVRNDCLPDTPEEMLAGEEILTNPLVDAINSRCEFEVQFDPANPREHGAEIAFRSDLDPRHSILLRGNGIGGALRFEVPDLPVPTSIPEPLCVDALIGSCTRNRIVRITNTGPGAVTITNIQFAIGTPNWEIVAPPAAALPITLAAGDPPLDVTVRWCDSPPPVEGRGVLSIDTNAPDTPSFTAVLQRQPPPGMCPAGS